MCGWVKWKNSNPFPQDDLIAQTMIWLEIRNSLSTYPLAATFLSIGCHILMQGASYKYYITQILFSNWSLNDDRRRDTWSIYIFIGNPKYWWKYEAMRDGQKLNVRLRWWLPKCKILTGFVTYVYSSEEHGDVLWTLAVLLSVKTNWRSDLKWGTFYYITIGGS